MQKATISELKNHLSAFLKKVRAGHSVIVYDRDQPIARIERIEALERDDELATRLERAGLLRRARTPLPLSMLKAEAPRAELSLVEALLEERRDGR
ncbi:MAG: type II toxin-antitoxin system prevent-host-death family antitoxin [Gammaproteobacteria bacterium]